MLSLCGLLILQVHPLLAQSKRLQSLAFQAAHLQASHPKKFNGNVLPFAIPRLTLSSPYSPADCYRIGPDHNSVTEPFLNRVGSGQPPPKNILAVSCPKRFAGPANRLGLSLAHQGYAYSKDSYSEPAYPVSQRTDGPILLTAAVLAGLSAVTLTSQQPLTARQVSRLQSSSVPGFDRSAIGRYSILARSTSDGMAVVSLTLPLLYLCSEETRKQFGTVFLMQVETGLVMYGLQTLTKTLVNRPRPYTYNPAVPLADKLTRDSRQSFFSGHVAMTASMGFFMATTYAHYHPDSKYKRLVWLYAVTWPAVTGYCRYAAGKHFPTDILAGYATGAFTGWLIPKIHQCAAARKGHDRKRSDRKARDRKAD